MFFNIKLEKGLSKLIGIDSSKGTLQKGKDADILIIVTECRLVPNMELKDLRKNKTKLNWYKAA